MLRNHVTCLDWLQDLMVYCKRIVQPGMLALKISPSKWILLTNEETMKSPVGFAMSGSFYQANPSSVSLRDSKEKCFLWFLGSLALRLLQEV